MREASSKILEHQYGVILIGRTRLIFFIIYALIIIGSVSITWWQRQGYESQMERMYQYHLTTTNSAATIRQELNAISNTLLSGLAHLNKGEIPVAPIFGINTSLYIVASEVAKIVEKQSLFRGVEFEAIVSRIEEQSSSLYSALAQNIENPVTANLAIEQIEALMLSLEQLQRFHTSTHTQMGKELPRKSRTSILASSILVSALLLVSAVFTHQILKSNDRSGKALKASEEKHHLLFTHANDGIIILDGRKETITNLNPKACALLGYSKEELIGESMIVFCPRPEHQKLTDKITHLTQGKKSLVETRLKRKDNSLIDVELNASAYSHEDNAILQILVRDISERKNAEREKSLLEEKLRQSQKLDTVGTLAAGIAHDFNNILTPIVGYSDHIEESLSPDDPLHEEIEAISRNAKRAKKLVQQILLFSREADTEKSAANPVALLEESLELVAPSTPSSITVRKSIATNCGFCYVNESQVQQAIVNIYMNAVHAMEQSGGILTISLEKKAPSNLKFKTNNLEYCCLSIEDSGYGMDQTTVDRIFDPFFTTKDVGKGTGLGLAVSHGIISHHKGFIDIESQLGVGSCFRMYLPTIGDADAKGAAPKS